MVYFIYILDELINLSDFIEMLCLFVFLDDYSLFSLILSLSGVRSNVVITVKQARGFFKLIQTPADEVNKFHECVREKYINDNLIPIKFFYEFFIENPCSLMPLRIMKHCLINKVIKPDIYKAILLRRSYYSNKICNNIKESCIDSLLRACNGRPDPLCHNYVPPEDKSFCTVSLKVKQRFGYSQRLESPYSSSIISDITNLKVFPKYSLAPIKESDSISVKSNIVLKNSGKRSMFKSITKVHPFSDAKIQQHLSY